MSLLGVISDVHGDAEALRRALIALRARGCSRVWCAGNLVHYGLAVDEVVRTLVAERIPTVRGNHDRWALERRVEAFAPETWRFLAGLPGSFHRRVGRTRIAMVHGSPIADLDALYPGHLTPDCAGELLDRAEAEVLIVGHTRLPTQLTIGHRRIVNPGALRRSVEVVAGRTVYGGTYGVLEVPRGTFRVFDLEGRERIAYSA